MSSSYFLVDLTECEKEEPTDESHHFKQELEAMEEELGKVKMDKARMETAVEKQKGGKCDHGLHWYLLAVANWELFASTGLI